MPRKWIRQVRPNLWQLRIPAGQCRWGEYQVNGGCHPSVAAALAARHVVIVTLSSGGTPWDAVTALISRGLVTPRIGVRYVHQVTGGYAVKARLRGKVVELAGPFPSAWDASEAATRALRG